MDGGLLAEITRTKLSLGRLILAKTVNIHAAKTHLSRLVEEAAAGREVIIAKAGKPIARLVPLQAEPRRKQLGALKGQIKVSDDFDAPLDAETLALFEGR